jgi:hypothetical protein
MNTPNPNQPHASIALTAAASTLAQLGYILDAKSANLIIQAVGGSVRCTLNGNDPGASSGLKIADGDMIQIGSVEARLAKFIIESGTPKLEVAAYVL